MNETGLRYLISLERMEGCLPPECAYIDSIPALRSLDRLRFSQPVTFFVGENGSGKSTLLEAIAANYGLNPEGGSANFHFSTQSTHSALYRAIRLGKSPSRPQDAFFLRAESFYNVASEVDRLEAEQPGMLDSYGGISLHGQSHGESFLSLVLHRFRGRGLYLLDEPEAALSPLRQLSLLRAMRDLVCAQSQFIIATHSPILMAYPGAEIFTFGEDGIHSISYEETEHYQITRAFLENPARMLRELFAETDEGD